MLRAVDVRAQSVTVFTHVAVIDARDSLPRRDQIVVIRANRIIAAGASRTTRMPVNARIIDGRGKYTIPGLWDMHVHTATVGGRDMLRLYIANGVTGVRDMASDWPAIKQWRAEIAAGSLVGPRIIQVHGQLTPNTYFAIARRARGRGIPFSGHVSRAVGSVAASDSRQRSIEHLLAIPSGHANICRASGSRVLASTRSARRFARTLSAGFIATVHRRNLSHARQHSSGCRLDIPMWCGA